MMVQALEETRFPVLAAAPSDASSPRGLSSAGSLDLSIIVPTFNEAGNVDELVRRVEKCMTGARWEMIFVDDDSADGTADLVEAIGRGNDRIRCLRRIGRRGLSSACTEGMAMARGRFHAVMDADLQHDESLLPAMLRAIAAGKVDLVVGSRYVDGGCVASWNPARRALSRAATIVTRSLLRVELSDPMSGFFMIRQDAARAFDAGHSGRGFKLLLDIVASSEVPLRILELPYRFATRTSGESKLGAGVAWSFVRLLARHAVKGAHARFAKFCLVGCFGVLVHLTVLWSTRRWLQASFPAAQTAAVLVSIASNFWLNNRLSFGDRRLRGAQFFAGMSRFALLCAAGAVVNVMTASTLHRAGAQGTISAIVGILAAATCNYLTVSRLVWRP